MERVKIAALIFLCLWAAAGAIALLLWLAHLLLKEATPFVLTGLVAAFAAYVFAGDFVGRRRT